MKLGQGYVFTCVCDSIHRGRGWYPSMHCRWYPSMPCRSPGPHPGGMLKGLALGGSPGPYPGGGGVEGSGLGGSPGPHPGGGVEGSGLGGLQAHNQRWGVSRPTPRGYPSMHWGRHPPMATAAGAVHILLECILVVCGIQMYSQQTCIYNKLELCVWIILWPKVNSSVIIIGTETDSDVYRSFRDSRKKPL